MSDITITYAEYLEVRSGVAQTAKACGRNVAQALKQLDSLYPDHSKARAAADLKAAENDD